MLTYMLDVPYSLDSNPSKFSSQGQNLALTVLYVPYLLDIKYFKWSQQGDGHLNTQSWTPDPTPPTLNFKSQIPSLKPQTRQQGGGKADRAVAHGIPQRRRLFRPGAPQIYL